MPDSRPRIIFNSDQICNACENAKYKDTVDWSSRKSEFNKIVEKIKNDKKNEEYDCVVPWSGGKDSTSIALKLKFDYGLNPLLVTFSPLIKNECGIFNRELINKKALTNFSRC